jgi:hypothetical protein
MSPPPAPVLSQMNPAHTLHPPLFMICFNIILPSTLIVCIPSGVFLSGYAIKKLYAFTYITSLFQSLIKRARLFCSICKILAMLNQLLQVRYRLWLLDSDNCRNMVTALSTTNYKSACWNFPAKCKLACWTFQHKLQICSLTCPVQITNWPVELFSTSEKLTCWTSQH